MHIPRTLAIVLAGGQGSRMGVLTENRAKPALRVAGGYRLIDVALSNLANSHLSDVWLVEQHLPHTLNEHLSAGRPWDMDRTHGGLMIQAPFTGGPGQGFSRGNSDALWRLRGRIADHDPELVLVLSADHLYTMNLLEVLATHQEKSADLTMVTSRGADDPSRHGVVQTTRSGRIQQFWYKPEEPPTDLVAAEIFCFTTSVLLAALEELAAPSVAGEEQEESGLGDYGDDLVPHLVATKKVVEHRLDGYWRDIGTIQAYWESHMRILDGDGVRLDDPAWPIRSAQDQLIPARILAGADVADSLIAAGTRVAGSVRRSVLSPGVEVEEGAEVIESVVLDGARIGRGVRLVRCIVDAGAQVTGPADAEAPGPGTGGTEGSAGGVREIGGEERVTVVGAEGAVAEVEAEGAR